MQATRGATENSLDPKASRMPEYVYRVGILVAVILLLWTVV
jgi:hypothetical protein